MKDPRWQVDSVWLLAESGIILAQVWRYKEKSWKWCVELPSGATLEGCTLTMRAAKEAAELAVQEGMP